MTLKKRNGCALVRELDSARRQSFAVKESMNPRGPVYWYTWHGNDLRAALEHFNRVSGNRLPEEVRQ